MSSNGTEDLEGYAQYRIGNYIWIYISPILLIIGTVGNILSTIVLLRPTMRKSTTMFYLTCLSLGDLFALYTGLLRYWILHAFDIEVRNLSSASCKIHAFLVYVFLDFTVWNLVSLTIDRCIYVSLPLRANRLCSLVRSKWIVCIILLLLVVKNMHFLWTLELVYVSEFRCDICSVSAFRFISYVWPWIDFSASCLIPFTVMIVCNIKIIYEMYKRKRFTHTRSHTKPSTFKSHLSVPGPSLITCQSATSPAKSLNTINRAESISETKAKAKARRLSSLTVMLLSINCVFLITTFPNKVFLIGEIYWFPDIILNTPDANLWWAIANTLQYMNNAIHFFLYCLTGPRFRQELKSIFKMHNQIANSHDQTNLSKIR